MNQRFFQGRTNNHLTWVMVDSTDFATPESAMSAATKIKIYGKLQSATGTNFVTSGTGSLTNDITHVGASATGIYTIALAKADLSDASAAWYDQYVCSLSATGAAYQMMVIEGVLAGGITSNISATLSDVQSYLAVMSGALSDTYSAVILTQSYASDAASAAAQANSRVLLGNSMISDVDSALTSQFALISDAISNVYSATLLTQSLASDAASAAAQGNSRILVTQSYASDAASAAREASSRVLLGNSMISDIDSALTSQLALSTSAFSDILSVTRGNSATLSDIDSALTSQFALTTSSLSDIYSAIGDVSVTLTASDISDIASQTAVATAAAVGSMISDIYSVLTTARAEPGQGAPPASTDMLTKMDYIYKAWRNRTVQTPTKYRLYNDDATTVGQSATLAATATAADRAEVGTGA